MSRIQTLLSTFTLTGALMWSVLPARAQCPFDPTVTPAGLMLCPEEQAELSTQVYDSYQWYRAGQPLAGETGPTLTVDALNDVEFHFSVEATLDGCTEMSPEVLVGGWAFLPPAASTSENYLFIDEGTAVFCAGDTGYLVLLLPYDTNIQWTNNGAPIPGATDDTLVVTTTGNYHVSGAPAPCPNFQQPLFNEMPVVFQDPVQPVIMMGDASICAQPEGVVYQWFLDGTPIAGNTPCILPSSAGSYTVEVTYDPDCSIPSEAYLVTGMAASPGRNVPLVGPLPANDRLTVTSVDGDGISAWNMLDASGRAVLQGHGAERSVITLDVSMLTTGTYWLRLEGHVPLAVSVVR